METLLGKLGEGNVRVLLVWHLQTWTSCWDVLVPQKTGSFLWGKIYISTSERRVWAPKCAVRKRHSPAATVLFFHCVHGRIFWFQSLFIDLWVRINDFPKLRVSGRALFQEGTRRNGHHSRKFFWIRVQRDTQSPGHRFQYLSCSQISLTAWLLVKGLLVEERRSLCWSEDSLYLTNS